MLHDFMYSLWFFLPAGYANLAPVVIAKLPGFRDWDAPLDGKLHYRGKRLFGASKTWRGLICGTIVAVLTFWLQRLLSTHLGSFTTYLDGVHYGSLSWWLPVLLGVGALIGDAVESFFKRQLSVAPGASWFPFDQLDYIIGGCLLSALVTVLPPKIYVWIVLVWFVMHLACSYIGYLLHFKKTPI